MSKFGLLSAGFSAVLGKEVVLQEGGAASLSIHDVFKQTYTMKPPGFTPPSPEPVHETFPIFVKSLCRSCYGNDDIITLQVTERHSVFEMKRQIQGKIEIPLEQFDLIFHNECLDDDRTVKDYGLQPESTVYLRCRLKGGGGPLTVYVSTDGLAPRFDCDFTYATEDGRRFMRGRFEYKRPYGWKRYAVRALGRYENDEWLGPDGDRTEEASGEWPVSYHGTNINNADKIIKEGYKPGSGRRFGTGIYTSPSLEMVERLYAQPFSYNGKTYKMAFQNRVNPDRNGHLEIYSALETGEGADYWLSPNDNEDVRPYGILIREVSQTKSQPWLQSNPFFSVSAAQSAQSSPQTQTDSICSLQ